MSLPVVRRTHLLALTAAATLAASSARSDEETDRAPPPAADSPASESSGFAPRFATKAITQWSIGDPTAEEQYLLELMNRARMDPVGEGDRIFVDYDSARVKQMVDFFLKQRPGVEYTRAENRDAFHGYTARMPLTFDSHIIDAARTHSGTMRQYDQQSHQVQDTNGNFVEPVFRSRLENAGFFGANEAESVFGFADDMLHAHAGFAIDPGQPLDEGAGNCNPNGRPCTGHRDNLMDLNALGYRLVGVGVISDSDPKTHVGPHLVTIDFAQPAFSPDVPNVFVTGVVYDDGDGDGFYSVGEGLKDVRIDLDVGNTFAMTSTSGGYAIPVTGSPGVVHVTATAQAGTPAEHVVGTQTVAVNVTNSSVKVDFGRPPDPPMPSPIDVTQSASQPISAASAAVSTITLPADGSAGIVDSVTLDATIDHPARGELKVSLIGPTGLEVVLFDGGPNGTNLHGSFDSSLSPLNPLSAFAGLTYVGTWKLKVVDSAAGNSGTLTSWTLHVQPQWARPLGAPATPLFVTKLATKVKPTPMSDTLQIAALVDVGSTTLGAVGSANLRLLAADGTNAELFSSPLPASAVKRSIGGTSKASVSAKLSKLDLPALPATVIVELAVDDAVVRETVPLVKGSFNGTLVKPAQQAFHVDTVKTLKPVGGVPTYSIMGRLATTGTLLGTSGSLELFLGGVHEKDPLKLLVAKGKLFAMKGGKAIKLLTIDPTKGSFAMTVGTSQTILTDGRVDVALRLGDDGFYGATSVVPTGTSASPKY